MSFKFQCLPHNQMYALIERLTRKCYDKKFILKLKSSSELGGILRYHFELITGITASMQ